MGAWSKKTQIFDIKKEEEEEEDDDDDDDEAAFFKLAAKNKLNDSFSSNGSYRWTKQDYVVLLLLLLLCYMYLINLYLFLNVKFL